ncbi:pseudouridine synthase [Estrella lausannensis]|nr:pseudouridine synthase [Estrella lausannensis]
MDTLRLNLALAKSGVASRRKCDELIFAGRVTVNGKVADNPGIRVSETDRIAVNGRSVRVKKTQYYFLLNKPKGYVCSAKPANGQNSVLTLFKDVRERLFTVGRLDKETTGLILVTNDGDFANRVMHPSFGIQKEYLAKVWQEITDVHLKTLMEGIEMEGVLLKPVRVTKVRKGTLKITVMEGKKREVREMVAHAGLDLFDLKRIRIGGLHLGTLSEGVYRNLTESEKNSLFGTKQQRLKGQE